MKDEKSERYIYISKIIKLIYKLYKFNYNQLRYVSFNDGDFAIGIAKGQEREDVTFQTLLLFLIRSKVISYDKNTVLVTKNFGYYAVINRNFLNKFELTNVIKTKIYPLINADLNVSYAKIDKIEKDLTKLENNTFAI